MAGIEEASTRVRSTMTTCSLRLKLHDSGAIRVSAWENIFIAASSLPCCSVLGPWPIISAKWDAAGSNSSAGKALAWMEGAVQKGWWCYGAFEVHNLTRSHHHHHIHIHTWLWKIELWLVWARRVVLHVFQPRFLSPNLVQWLSPHKKKEKKIIVWDLH